MPRSVFIDGRRRSVVTLPGYRLGVRPANAGNKYPAETYSREQIHRLMSALGRGNAGARNRAIVVTMWRSGLRVAEVLDLVPRDVDLAAGTVTIRHGKGDRRRVVGIDPEAAAVVEAWLARRTLLEVAPARPLFCVISRPSVGRPVYSSCIREALKDAGDRAGLTAEGVRVHPHAFRHTFASELAREGVPVNVIKALLGHSSLATTARYLDHLSPWEAIDTIRARQWAPITHGPAPSVSRPLIAA